MKTILVMSDFSIRAQYAAQYAYSLAKKIKADLILGHAMEIVEAAPMAEQMAWPVADHLALHEESTVSLREVATLLQAVKSAEADFVPKISCLSEFGRLSAVIDNFVYDRKVDLVVMGAHRSNGLSRFLFGSHTHDVLDNVNCPVMLVPETTKFKGLSSIAYATDLTFSDSKVIKYMVKLAKPFNAEILVSHVSSYGGSSSDCDKTIRHYADASMAEGEPKVFYSSFKGNNVSKSLLEIIGNGKADLLALVHKQYGLIEGLFHSSISKQLANTGKVPLLILPHSFSVDAADLTNDNLEHYCFAPNDSR